MRRFVHLLAVTATWVGVAQARDEVARPGIRWEPDLPAAFERAAKEGRAVLVAVNAIEQESANALLARELYPSAEWGEATRGFVCLVANPNDHAGADGLCTRYGGIPCSVHRAALGWVTARFGPDLVSPQHLLVEPDGEVAWRKEYFSGDVTPELLESLLSRVTPRSAIRRASAAREERIRALEQAAIETVGPTAEAWLHSGDGLAAAGVCALLDWCEGPRRLALVRALARTPPGQLPVLVEASESRVLAPDEEPDLTLAWLGALKAVDLEAGERAAARVLARTRSAEVRAAVRKDHPEPVPTEEVRPPLDGVLEREDAWPAGVLRAVLLAASGPDVRERAGRVAALLRDPRERIRIAAALALVAAGRGADPGVAEAIADAIDDPVEGPETRAEGARRLGTDPGGDRDAWLAAVRAKTGGAR